MYIIKNKKKILEYIISICVILLIISILLPFVVLSFYNHPSITDDYFCTMLVKQTGVIGFMAYMFDWGSSRYIANIFHACNPLVWDSFEAYHYTPLFFLFILALSFYFFITQITQKIFNTYQYLFATLTFLAIILTFLPTTAEFFYWFSSAVLYVPATSFLFLFFAFFASYAQNPRSFHIAVLLILAFLILGTSEIIIIFWILALFYAAIFNFRRGNYRLFKQIMIFLSLATLFFLLITFGLGSHKRMQGVTRFTINNLIETIAFTSHYLMQVFSWAKNLTLLCFTALYLPFAVRIAKKIDMKYLNPLFTTIYSIFILFTLLFSFLLFSKLMFQRVFSTIYIIFILSWFFNITIYTAWILRKFPQISELKMPFSLSMGLLVVIAIKVFSLNTKTGVAYQDWFSDAAEDTDKVLKERYLSIQQQRQRGLRVVKIKPTSHYLEVISFRNDFDKQDIHSLSFAKYWQVDSIKYDIED